MTGNDTISIALLLAIGSLIVSVIGVIINIKKANKETADDKKKALEAENERQLKMQENFVKVNLKLDTFCDTTKELMKQNEKTSDSTQELTKQMIKCSERIETLFRYKDDHERRISDLEDKVK